MDQFPTGGALDEIMQMVASKCLGWAHRLARSAVWTGKFTGMSPIGFQSEEYWTNGKRDRADGPAVIVTWPDGHCYEEFWLNGQRKA